MLSGSLPASTLQRHIYPTHCHSEWMDDVAEEEEEQEIDYEELLSDDEHI